VNAALWLMALALPLAAPPKLLINAQLDSTSAAAGLERAFRPLVSAQPQPAWIGYSVPLPRGYNLGCDYVSPGGWTAPGVVHLEPPDHAVVLFRAEGAAITRIRVLSPDCEIDAGSVPVHWLEEVEPGESSALLQAFAAEKNPDKVRENAIRALSLSTEPSAVEFLISLARKDQNARVRRMCVTALARSTDPRAIAFFKDVLKP
jgi:hypothetical protein